MTGNVFPEMCFRKCISEKTFPKMCFRKCVLFMTDSICESSLVTKIWTGNGVTDRWLFSPESLILFLIIERVGSECYKNIVKDS